MEEPVAGPWSLYTIPGNDSSLGFQRGLVFQGRGATKMVIGDPKMYIKTRAGPESGEMGVDTGISTASPC